MHGVLHRVVPQALPCSAFCFVDTLVRVMPTGEYLPPEAGWGDETCAIEDQAVVYSQQLSDAPVGPDWGRHLLPGLREASITVSRSRAYSGSRAAAALTASSVRSRRGAIGAPSSPVSCRVG